MSRAPSTSDSYSAKTSIVFDGDDALWGTQELYDHAKSQFFAVLDRLGYGQEVAAAKFAELDMANVAQFGFAKERFPTSMRQTYEFFCTANDVPPRSEVVDEVIAIGTTVFTPSQSSVPTPSKC